MDWRTIHCGYISQEEIAKYVRDKDWQMIRLSMKGAPMSHRFNLLKGYLGRNNHSRAAQVRVTNYINALSRGGMLHPSEYQKKGV